MFTIANDTVLLLLPIGRGVALLTMIDGGIFLEFEHICSQLFDKDKGVRSVVINWFVALDFGIIFYVIIKFR